MLVATCWVLHHYFVLFISYWLWKNSTSDPQNIWGFVYGQISCKLGMEETSSGNNIETPSGLLRNLTSFLTAIYALSCQNIPLNYVHTLFALLWMLSDLLDLAVQFLWRGQVGSWTRVGHWNSLVGMFNRVCFMKSGWYENDIPGPCFIDGAHSFCMFANYPVSILKLRTCNLHVTAINISVWLRKRSVSNMSAQTWWIFGINLSEWTGHAHTTTSFYASR